MRNLALTGAVCALVGFAGAAHAQVNTMPGQIVGNGFNLSPAGQPAGQPVGQPVNMPAENSHMRPYNPNRPYDMFKGSTFSPDQLVAPIPGVAAPSLLEKFNSRLKAMLGPPQSLTPPVQNTGYFPSLTRRNRERAEQRLWRRD